jgi:protein-tyrosine phosphatase
VYQPSRLRRLVNKVFNWMYGPEPGYVCGMMFSPGDHHPGLTPEELRKSAVLEKFLRFVSKGLSLAWEREVMVHDGTTISEFVSYFRKERSPQVRHEAQRFYIDHGLKGIMPELKRFASVLIQDKSTIIKEGDKFSRNDLMTALVERGWVYGIEGFNPAPNIMAYFVYKGEALDLYNSLSFGSTSGIKVELIKLLSKLGLVEDAYYLSGKFIDSSNFLFGSVEVLGLVRSIFPEVEITGIEMLFKKIAGSESAEGFEELLVTAGLIYPKDVIDIEVKRVDPYHAWLLRLGQFIFKTRKKEARNAIAAFLAFWREAAKLQKETKDKLTAEIVKRKGWFNPALYSLIDELAATGDVRTDDVMKVALRNRLAASGINNPELERRLADDPAFSALIPSILEIAEKTSLFLHIAHWFSTEKELAGFKDLLISSDDALIKIFQEEKDVRRKVQVLVAIETRDRQRVFDPRHCIVIGAHVFPRGFDARILKPAAELLAAKDEEIPPALRDLIKEKCLAAVKDKFADLIGPGGEAEAVPQKIKDLAKQSAGLAHKVLGLVRGVAKQTKKPTLDIYILSTAHGFNGERILESLYKNPAARKALLQRIAQEGEAYAQKVKELDAIQDEAQKTEDEMRLVHLAFYSNMEATQKKEGCGRLKAIMAVGRLWMQKGYLDYFTYPLEIKVPSGSGPTPEVRKQLEAIAREAGANGWDIVLIDHSTVRTKNQVHKDDPPEFEKGRAIARAMVILKNAVTAAGGKANGQWLYKENDWDLAKAYPASGGVNIIGLNLYDGKVYDYHVRGKKEEWIKFDDHARTILGVGVGGGWGNENAKVTASQVALARRGDDSYEVVSVPKLFWAEFRRELARLEGWPPTAPSFKYSNVLFVCNANHHRSPVMDILFKRLLRETVGPDAEKVAVASAGIEAQVFIDDHPEKTGMSPRARKMLADRGIEVEDFRKTQLTKAQTEAADIILVMTQREKAALLNKFPGAAGKVFVIKEWLGFPESDIITPKDFTPEVFEMFWELANKIVNKIVV